MSPSTVALRLKPRLEDVLVYLAISNRKEYRKGLVIYSPSDPFAVHSSGG